MNLLIALTLLTQIESGVPAYLPSAAAYFPMERIPAYSAGYSHCEQDPLNPHYYACKPHFIHAMGERFPFVEFSGHRLDWDHKAGLYRYNYLLSSGSADPYAGQPVKWTERQNYDSKQVERTLILPKVSIGKK